MSTDHAIKLAGVSKSYPRFTLSDIDLELEPGHIMGFIGPNGAGKSTTIRIIMGLIRADRGRVEVLGQAMPRGQVAAKWHIGFASEDMRLYGSRTLQWHIDFCRSIYADWDEDYETSLIRRFNLRSEQKVKGLSHGERVKAGLLLVLARRPRLLVLDEPTTGLDPVARSEVLDELLDVLRDERRSVLFSSHNTNDIEQLSDEITFVDRGRIIESQDKESFLDKWRRIRVEVANGYSLPELAGTVGIRQNGQLAAITTNAYDQVMTSLLEQSGATVRIVENLTLEEIFVAEVKASRSGEHA